jgi:hypothetical protein
MENIIHWKNEVLNFYKMDIFDSANASLVLGGIWVG